MAGVLELAGPIAIAHRGGGKEAPENSLEAFQRAYDQGFRWFETDVQATADGQLVLFHDRRLLRLAGSWQEPADLDLDQLDRVLTRTAPQIGGVVRLSELFAAFPDVVVNIDPKHDAAAPLLARFLADPARLGRALVASFDHDRLQWLRTALGPRLATALSPREVGRLVLAARTRRGPPWRGAHAAQVPTGPVWAPLVDQRLVDRAHDLGLPVHVWTIDDPAEMQRLLDLGVDAIMTDRPSVLREVLHVRGEWQEP